MTEILAETDRMLDIDFVHNAYHHCSLEAHLGRYRRPGVCPRIWCLGHADVTCDRYRHLSSWSDRRGVNVWKILEQHGTIELEPLAVHVSFHLQYTHLPAGPLHHDPKKFRPLQQTKSGNTTASALAYRQDGGGADQGQAPRKGLRH